VFEFGTSHGRTTLQLALNSPEDARIYTLESPRGYIRNFLWTAFPEEDILRKLPVRVVFRDHV